MSSCLLYGLPSFSALRKMSRLPLLLVLAVLPLSGCLESEEHLFGSFYLCEFAREGAVAVYLMAGECEDVPDRNYIQPTDWGIGGGYEIEADTCASPPRFFLIGGDFAIDTTDVLFTTEHLQHLPVVAREGRLPASRCLVRLQDS